MTRQAIVFLFVACMGWSVQPNHAAAHAGPEALIEWLDVQLRDQPNSQPLYIKRGSAWSDSGHYDQAARDLAHARTLGDPVEVDLALGVLLYRQGELKSASVSLDRYLEQHPSNPHALEYRARVKRDAGNTAGALADLQALFALRSNPDPGYYLSAANMLETAPGGGTDAALELLDRGMVQLGLIPQLQLHAVELEIARGRLPNALSRLQSLEQTLHGSAQWKADMGALFAQMGRGEEARQWYLAARRQLQAQRITPARIALQGEVVDALATLDSN